MRNEVGKVGNTGLCKLYLSEVSCRFIFVLKKNMINLGTYELSTVFKVIYFAARMADYRGIL